jgi:hypothetical protein
LTHTTLAISIALFQRTAMKCVFFARLLPQLPLWRPALAEYYATQRFNLIGLNAELLNRMEIGNKVIDHERISGVRELPFEVAAVYEVADDLIRTVWFFAANEGGGVTTRAAASPSFPLVERQWLAEPDER